MARRERDAKIVVIKVMGLAVLTMYEIWKVMCEEVAKVALPMRKQVQWNEIERLRDKVEEVESRDRCLFVETHMPKTSNTLQRMEDWVRAVDMALKRAERSMTIVMSRMEEYV